MRDRARHIRRALLSMIISLRATDRSWARPGNTDTKETAVSNFIHLLPPPSLMQAVRSVLGPGRDSNSDDRSYFLSSHCAGAVLSARTCCKSPLLPPPCEETKGTPRRWQCWPSEPGQRLLSDTPLARNEPWFGGDGEGQGAASEGPTPEQPAQAAFLKRSMPPSGTQGKTPAGRGQCSSRCVPSPRIPRRSGTQEGWFPSCPSFFLGQVSQPPPKADLLVLSPSLAPPLLASPCSSLLPWPACHRCLSLSLSLTPSLGVSPCPTEGGVFCTGALGSPGRPVV